MAKKNQKKGTSKGTKNTEPKAEKKKSTYRQRVVAVSRQATVDVNGTAVEVNVRMYAVADEEKARLELDDAPEFASRKECQAFITARRNELRGTSTPKRVERAIKRYERVAGWIEKDKAALEEGHPCHASYDLMLSAAKDAIEKLRAEAEGEEEKAA